MTRHIHKISRYTPSILQGTLQLEVARPRAGLARELPFERRALLLLSIALIGLVSIYLYFVASSILNVMVRSEAEGAMRRIEGSIGALEQQYLALSRSIQAQSADGLGLSPVRSTAYVYRSVDTAMADSREAQIY